MHIKITADSTCDIGPELIGQNGVGIVPLAVLKGGEEHLDGVDITPADIFSFVGAGGALCTTAARNPEEYRAMFANWRRECDCVIHISLGSKFSSSYMNACIAARDMENVFVVDSQNLSTGQGHVVMEACALARQCADAKEILAELQSLIPRVDASFLIDRLDYMVKGGRCSTVAALGANLLWLKPCIEVTQGAMRVCKKYRGSYEHSMRAYVRERLGRPGIRRGRLFVTYTDVPDSLLQTVRDTIKECGAFDTVHETWAGCTVSCHCGPGTLGVLFIREQ